MTHTFLRHMLGAGNAWKFLSIAVGVGIFVGSTFSLLATLLRGGWGGGDFAIRNSFRGITWTRGF